MIKLFKIKNYKSYKGEAEISFEALDSDYASNNVAQIPLEDGRKISLLKTLAIFGANASGKSNVIWALDALQSMVHSSLGYDSNRAIEGYYPFMFDEDTRNQPSEFTIEFVARGDEFRYHISFSKIVNQEELYIRRGKEFEQIFARKNSPDEHSAPSYGKEWAEQLKEVAVRTLLPNQLLLSLLGRNNIAVVQKAYTFLSEMLVMSKGDVFNLKMDNFDAANKLANGLNEENKKRLVRLIHVADLGIAGIEMEKLDESKLNFPNYMPDDLKKELASQLQWNIRLIHKNKEGDRKYQLQREFESLGTKTIFGVGARILHVLEKGGVLVYDEMNFALHPEIFKLLVSLFSNPVSNPYNAQLLLTTHEHEIASDGRMRADQVWFAEKINGESSLFSAQDFEDIEISLPFDKWYKAGRFGALPKIGTIEYIFSNTADEN